MTIATLFTAFKDFMPDLNPFIFVAFYIIGILVLSITAFVAYHRISKEHSFPLKLAAIIPALVVVNIPEGISAAIICLLTIYSA